jgi:hypothetical protein
VCRRRRTPPGSRERRQNTRNCVKPRYFSSIRPETDRGVKARVVPFAMSRGWARVGGRAKLARESIPHDGEAGRSVPTTGETVPSPRGAPPHVDDGALRGAAVTAGRGRGAGSRRPPTRQGTRAWRGGSSRRRPSPGASPHRFGRYLDLDYEDGLARPQPPARHETWPIHRRSSASSPFRSPAPF